MECKISMVIGSWGSYNAYNERALGSKWLDLSDYECWDEIVEELEEQGFDLNGIDEELFVQDFEGIPTDGVNWDYVNPKELYEKLLESEVLSDDYKLEKMQAYLECRNFDDFLEMVDNYGSNWDDDIYLYKGFVWADLGREYFESCCYKLPANIADFIDFDAYGRYIGYDAEEYSGGIIEICR